jgi:hypothetical protein
MPLNPKNVSTSVKYFFLSEISQIFIASRYKICPKTFRPKWRFIKLTPGVGVRLCRGVRRVAQGLDQEEEGGTGGD